MISTEGKDRNKPKKKTGEKEKKEKEKNKKKKEEKKRKLREERRTSSRNCVPVRCSGPARWGVLKETKRRQGEKEGVQWSKQKKKKRNRTDVVNLRTFLWENVC